MSFSDKSLKLLELDAVLNMLSEKAVSTGAKSMCVNLTPCSNADDVVKAQDETLAAISLSIVNGSPPFGGIKDIRASLDRAVLGGALNARELIEISSVLRNARLVKSYIADDKLSATSIDYLFNSLKTNKYLEEKISTSILSDDDISDCASSDLAEIRRKMRAASSKAREALYKIISSPSYAKALQESLITIRDDRYVVPVKSEYKGLIPGLIHDVSSTGATLFIEPMGVVKANNELRELVSKEKLEIEKILMLLSQECAEHKDDIVSDYFVLVKLDFIFAKAKLAFDMNCSRANISSHVSLVSARHPLLNKDIAVPINVELGNEFNTLVITGPNTGGKTVSLKTIGLLSAMNQCGLQIPVRDGSCLPIFSNFLADIGDEQSIEQNLSTFSAHMSNIVEIINECNEKSLVLFDELGAGTDPTEGAALAVSIIEFIRGKGALVVATTHYTELKVYATNEDGVLNASCEFDVDSLKPTYKLLMGVPGKSNAFAISKRMGLNDEIIFDAQNRVGYNSTRFESTIEKLEKTRLSLEKSNIEIEIKLNEINENNLKIEKIKKELETQLNKAEERARQEAEEIIINAKKIAEETFLELDQMRNRDYEEDVNAINTDRNNIRRNLNIAQDSITPVSISEYNIENYRNPVIGDFVKVRNIGLEAEVIECTTDGMLTLKSGAMIITAKNDEVIILNDSAKRVNSKKKTSSSAAIIKPAAKSEIDLRGLESLEAVLLAERFIDSAVMGKLNSVTIIHGKGTGALRNAIQSMLKKNKCVKSFRIGTYGEGESGVTIVELK